MLQRPAWRASSRPEASSCAACAAAGSSRRSGRRASRRASGRCRRASIDRASARPRPRCARTAEETGVEARLDGKLGDVRYVYTRGGRARVQGRQLLPAALPARGRIGELPAGHGARGRRGALAAARRRAAAARLPRRARDGREARSKRWPTRLYESRAVATYALNFYSPIVADQLRTHRKTATIRLGDKSTKYKKGMIVTVLVGVRYGQREKVFDAVIDKVEVKRLGDLSPREIEHDNPEIRQAEEFARFLGQLYNREVDRGRHGHGDPLLADRRDQPRASVPASAWHRFVHGLAAGLADRGAEELGAGGRPRRTPRTRPRTQTGTARRRPGSGIASRRRTAGSRRAARPPGPRRSSCSVAAARQNATQSPSVLRRSSWIQLRFGRFPSDIRLTVPPLGHAGRTSPLPVKHVNPWFVLSLVCMAQFMVILDATIVNVALPSIQTDLDVAEADLQWVVNSYTLIFGGFLLLGGRAGDLIGRKRLFLAGLVVFTVASLPERDRDLLRVSDPRARAPGPRRRLRRAGRALDPHNDVRGGPGSARRRWASGPGSPRAVPPSACCSAASSSSSSRGRGSSSSTCPSASRSSCSRSR